MTTLREQITEAVLALVTGLAGLPNPVRGEDDPRAQDYQPVTAGQDDPLQFLALLDEGCVAREGCPPVMGAGGVLYDWTLKLVVAYSARSATAATRVALRDAALAALTAAVLPPDVAEVTRRQLGGLVNWFWVEPAELLNNVFDGEGQLAVARVPLSLWFTANDPAA